MKTAQKTTLKKFASAYKLPEHGVTYIKMGGKKITQPDQAIDIKRSIEMYATGTLEERAKGYYEEQGNPIPNFERMTRVQQLEKLNEYREIERTQRLNLDTLAKAKDKRDQEAMIEKQVKTKLDEQRAKSTVSDKGSEQPSKG